LSNYYKCGGIEAIDVIEALGLDFNLGNVIKYIFRLGEKPNASPLDDLNKAYYYLEREIRKFEKIEYAGDGV